MQSLPRGLVAVLNSFSPLFTLPTWAHIQVLLTGAILCQGARRVSSILRVMGLSREKRFEKYHRVLNRAKWNSMAGAKILLGLLVQLLPSSSPILIVVDDTIERRSGKKIKAKGCYRDACRSTQKLVVKCFGLKWVCLMLIVPLPWCKRPWTLPFMTILAPSKKSNAARGRKHKTSIDLDLAPEQIVKWFVLRWNIEVTFEEMRAQLGMETQRQWSDKAIARTTPCLMALFSLTCLFAIEMLKTQSLPILSTAWYNKKSEATFSDILAFVRRSIWAKNYFNNSTFDGDYMKIKPAQWESLLEQLVRAA